MTCHSAKLGLEPSREAEKRKTSPDMKKKTLQAELRTISMTWEEAKKTTQDRERWRLVVKALCYRGNEEE